HFVDVGLSHAVLFSVEESVNGPVNDVLPDVVAVQDGRPEGLFGDERGQVNVIARNRERALHGDEARVVGGPAVALAVFVGGDAHRGGLEDRWGELNAETRHGGA